MQWSVAGRAMSCSALPDVVLLLAVCAGVGSAPGLSTMTRGGAAKTACLNGKPKCSALAGQLELFLCHHLRKRNAAVVPVLYRDGQRQHISQHVCCMHTAMRLLSCDTAPTGRA